MRLAGQMSECAGPGNERADAIPNGLRGLCPINLAVLLFDFRRVRNAFAWLRPRRDVASDVSWNGAREQFSADVREAIMERLRIIGRSNGRMLLGEDIAGVETDIHFHDGHAGFGVAIENSVLNGSGFPDIWGAARCGR